LHFPADVSWALACVASMVTVKADAATTPQKRLLDISSSLREIHHREIRDALRQAH
jgi:hypothetical protein